MLPARGRFRAPSAEDVYPTDLLKTAALFHAIINDHPFADGNKRTATFGALALLTAREYLIEAPSLLQIRLLGEVAIETALPGSLAVDEIAGWFDRILGPRP